MKKYVLLLLLAFVVVDSKAQIKQEYAIYDILVKMHEPSVPIANTTTKAIRLFNFKNLKDYDLHPRDTLNKAWKTFFNNIDTSKIKTEPLSPEFLAKYPTKPDSRDFLKFSPIILSPDNTKAVCSVTSFNKYTSGALMFLFEKRNGEWVYRRSYFIYVQ